MVAAVETHLKSFAGYKTYQIQMDVIITGTVQCQVKSVAAAFKITCRECKLHCADEPSANR